MGESIETTKIRIDELRQLSEQLCVGCQRKWRFSGDDKTHHYNIAAQLVLCQTPATITNRIDQLERTISPIWIVLFNATRTQIHIWVAGDQEVCPENDEDDSDIDDGPDGLSVTVRALNPIDALNRAEIRLKEFNKR